MLIDRRFLGPQQGVECEVCVVGAGPAGLTLALELARSGRDVVLIESGGRIADTRIQSLGNAMSFDTGRHAPMDLATRRQWGGTSNIWGGRCVPLDAADFEERSARGDAVWPFPHEALARYYRKACEYAVCGPPEFTAAEVFATSPAIVPGFVDGDVLASTLERWSLPTNFGAVYEREAGDNRRLRAYLGLTCVSLNFADGRRITGLAARSLDGKELRVSAQYYIIAAGGLESTRLLLNCRGEEGGVGNHSGKLGRYYMGHISGKIAEVHFSTPARQTVYGFERDRDGIYCRRRFTVSPRIQRERDLLNCALWLDNPALPDAAHQNGILSMAYIALSMPVLSRYLAPEAIRRAAIGNSERSSLPRHLYNVVKDLPATAAFVAPFVWRRYFARRKVPGFFLRSPSNRYALHYHGEQAPTHSSRVRLGEARDELGMRRLEIDFRYCAADVVSVSETHQLLDAHLRRLAIGRLQYSTSDVAESIARQAKDGFHQIGTTRMSRRPEDGVVNENCRVHKVDNLYVLSSSVFPTSGQANPTLTSIALAVRLAEHLLARLATRVT
jgi:choline dehydrogenase-like flavoprotein